MDFSDILSIVAVCITTCGAIISAIINSHGNKKAQELLQRHEKEMHALQDSADRQKRYDEHSTYIISNYLSAAKVFLGAPYHEEYAAFNRVSSEILMYIPQELKAGTQAMTRAIDDIFNTSCWNDSEGHDLRQPAIHDAKEQFYRLSEEFSDLGFKSPTSK